MADNSINFSNSRLIKLKNTSNKDEQYKDAGQKGLILRITPAGSKIFRMKLWDKNRRKTIQMVLGRYPELKINDAREIVANRISDIAHGIDLIDRQNAARGEQIFDDIFKIWINDFAKESKKTWDEDERRYDLYIRDHLGNLQLSDITPEKIRKWRITLTKKDKIKGKGKISQSTINRAFAIVSTVFNKCAPNMQNPCSQVAKYKEKSREKFLDQDELKRFFLALESIHTPQHLKDYLLLSLYTGARRSNILSMSWHDIKLDLRLWIIPGEQSKNNEPMVVPLVDQIVEILSRRKSETSSVYVFPGTGKTGHLVEPKKAWKSLLKRAGLDNSTRLHDLRRTMGSWQAITGSSTKLIGASLGHKTEAATAVYARLTIDPIRESMEKAVKAMEKAKDEPDKVVPIRKK